MSQRNAILARIREFFRQKSLLEVETPLLNPTGAIEPFLDPFEVARNAPRKSPDGILGSGYLITSPEYNLKILAADRLAEFPGIFEISRSFRQGDSGPHHTEEFLMLEWYVRGGLQGLKEQTSELIRFVAEGFRSQAAAAGRNDYPTFTVLELFNQFAGCDLSYDSLYKKAISSGLAKSSEVLRFDELFFSIFLNQIEPELRKEPLSLTPLFITEYPAELAALSISEGKFCERFELYWQGVELANAYHELRGKQEHLDRFEKLNQLRVKSGRQRMEIDSQFLESMEHLPDCSGIALGLDRLIMVLLGYEDLSQISPFWPVNRVRTARN